MSDCRIPDQRPRIQDQISVKLQSSLRDFVKHACKPRTASWAKFSRPFGTDFPSVGFSHRLQARRWGVFRNDRVCLFIAFMTSPQARSLARNDKKERVLGWERTVTKGKALVGARTTVPSIMRPTRVRSGPRSTSFRRSRCRFHRAVRCACSPGRPSTCRLRSVP
jgi:hypothetical protein